MNLIPCKSCAHFDQQFKYRNGKRGDAWYGWCKVRSTYPAKEWDPARPFDVDVKRVAAGTDRSKPLVVRTDGTLADCTFAVSGG